MLRVNFCFIERLLVRMVRAAARFGEAHHRTRGYECARHFRGTCAGPGRESIDIRNGSLA